MAVESKPREIAGAPVSRWQTALTACRRHFVFVAVFSAALNVLYLAPSIFMIQVYDRVIPSRGLETLVLMSFALIVALCTLGILDWARARLLVRVGVSLDHQLSPEVMRDVLTRRPAGVRRTQALREFDTLRQVLAGGGFLAAMDLPWALIFVVVIGIMHPVIALVAIAGTVVMVALSIANNRAVRKPIEDANNAAQISYGLLEQSSMAYEAIRGLGLSEALVAKHMVERTRATDLQAASSLGSSYFQSLIRFVRVALQSILLGVGAYFAIRGELSPGSMFAVSILGLRAIQPIEQLTTAWRSIIQARESYISLKDIFEAPATAAAPSLPQPNASLALQSVTVARGKEQAPILDNVSLQIGNGEIVGIVGKSGSGKTTLARVAIGLVKPDRGTTRVDGADLGQWDPDELGRWTGYMPQTLQLLPGTIRDNISRFRGFLGEDPQQVTKKTIAAARAAGAYEMIVGLSEGFNTELGRNGEGLSGGQAQRIALARALYDDPPLLILDEPNSFLDNEGETALRTALISAKARKACTLIIVHRGAVMGQCDRLVCLADGRVVKEGRREEVLNYIGAESKRETGSPVIGAIGLGRTT